MNLCDVRIYVLSAYSVRCRAREIVLREIHGATRFDIGRLVGKEFAGLLAVTSRHTMSAMPMLPATALRS